MARFVLKTLFVLLQTFVVSGKGVRVRFVAPQSSADRVRTAQEVWCWQGCMGRCVYHYSRPQRKKSKYLVFLVVTGASEGIGREYALQLASKGFNVVVSARNASALATLVSEIGACIVENDCPLSIHPPRSEAKSTGDKKVQAKAVTMDFSKVNDAAQWNKLESELAGLDIGVLGEYMRLVMPRFNSPWSLLAARESVTQKSDVDLRLLLF